jgi:hypothetical protein
VTAHHHAGATHAHHAAHVMWAEAACGGSGKGIGANACRKHRRGTECNPFSPGFHLQILLLDAVVDPSLQSI